MVPNGWKKTFLSEVSDRVIVGLATSVTDYYVSAGVPIIRNQNIKKGYFDDTEMLYLTPEFSKKHPNKRVKAGDVITKVGDTAVTSSTDLQSALYSHNINDTVKVTYYRDGKSNTADVKLSKSTSDLETSSSSSSN